MGIIYGFLFFIFYYFADKQGECEKFGLFLRSNKACINLFLYFIPEYEEEISSEFFVWNFDFKMHIYAFALIQSKKNHT